MSSGTDRTTAVSLNSAAFAGLVAAEFFGTFVNLALLAVLWDKSLLSAWAWGPLLLPFVLFAATASVWADRYSKRTMLVAARGGQVVALLIGAAVLAVVAGRGEGTPFEPIFGAGVLFLMVTVSLFFSPAKFGAVRELVAEDNLSKANGILQMTSMAAMVLGYAAAQHLRLKFSDDVPMICLLLAAVSLLGAASSTLVPRLAPAGAAHRFEGTLLADLWMNIKAVRRTRSLLLSVLGLAYFWFLAVAVWHAVVFDPLDVDPAALVRLSALGLGVGLGSFLAVRLSAGNVELGLVPFGAFGLGLFALVLSNANAFGSKVLGLFLLGVSGGVFYVPLVAMVQLRAQRDRLGGTIAASNVLTALLALATLVSSNAIANAFGLDGSRLFLGLGLLTIAVMIYCCWLLPEFLVRFIFWAFTHTIYRVRVIGREHVPGDGPGLLVCNHVSYADGFFVVASHHRLIRFLVYGGIASHPSLRWLARIMGVIPISSSDGPRALAGALRAARDSLRDGELVCIFAEGQISRTGNMLKFQRGFEKILQGVDAPIIPTFLDCVWGSIFSHQGGRFFWKLPKRVPYPVTVNFGRPLPPSTHAFQVREAVQELGAESVRASGVVQSPLHNRFVRMAARHPFRFCMADSGGTEVTYGKALVGTIAVTRVLQRRLKLEEKMVGVLLPPSVGGSLVNLALLSAGRIPINLNYTASSETIAACVEQCDIKTIISSPLVLKRIKITLPIEPTPVEDLKRDVGGFDKFVGMLGAFVLPGWITENWLMGLGRGKAGDLATIIFSSGSTGEPKGVMLSHHNLVSNAEAVIQVIDPTPADRIVGLLPLFHSFGFLANIAVPFLVGCGAVYHNNPLDSKEVGELTEKYRGSILLATPTFLRAYTRKIPDEQLKTLRWILTGAEKLPREVAQLFREKFGIEPMEGYGCTELSPVAAVNVPDFIAADGRQIGNKPGTVGHPIPGVAAKVVDPDTFADLPTGTNGLLLIKGPNVMQGYFGKPELTAQAIRDGWYVTGDIANLDDDGFITITDRLSRFSKIGGEMVPHLRIEETIRQVLGTDEQGGVVAGVPDPTRGERLVVIHPPLPITAEELWKKLNASGLPKLWVPGRDSFFEISELPYLGTGKLDLRRIKELARELTAQRDAASA